MSRQLPRLDLPDHVLQCATCGVEHNARALPEVCAICADERQYLPPDGRQRWSRPSKFAGRVDVTELEPGILALDVVPGDGPSIGIGQQAKVIVTESGCVMVDVPAAITREAVAAVRALGPMRAIIPTHPHMYGVQTLWSRALGDAPVLITRADDHWLSLRPATLRLIDDEAEPVSGVRVLRLGGHFPGSLVVHWPGLDGRGVLLAGDTIGVNPDRRTVSFMRSFPNHIPLSAGTAARLARAVSTLRFDRLYGNFVPALIGGAQDAVQFSARRHIAWARGDHDDLTAA